MESGHRNQILLTWSEEQQTFVAEVPELHVYRATGATYEEALAVAQEAIHHWIEDAQNTGQKLPPHEKRPLVEAREQLLARAMNMGKREAAACRGPGELLDESGLQIYGSQQMEMLLISEPIETEDTVALYTELQKAYVLGYRETAREHGWEIQK